MSSVLALRVPGVRPAPALRLLLPFALLHGAMLLYDLSHPERFLRADRALSRIEVIERFGDAWRAGEGAAFLASHGIPGDWLPQALLYLAGGAMLVIAVQVALALASLLWVREIGLRLGLPERHAAAAAALFALLPHSLVFPHELSTEALFVPLIVLAFRLALPGAAPAGALAFGAATLVRPVAALWPLIHAAAQRGSVRARLAFAALALAPLFAWMSFIHATTGELSMGRSAHDLGTNLYYRMHRMAAGLPEAQRPPVRGPGERRASMGEYLSYAAAHPGAAIAHAARDLATLGAKSGIERVTLDYLDLFPEMRAGLQKWDSGWRASVEKNGLAPTLLSIFRDRPALILSSAAGSAAWLALMALAAIGALAWLRGADGGAQARARLLLVGFVVYIFATAQSVDAAHSRHRAPAEFALCLLAVAGWAAMTSRSKARHGR